MPLWGTLQTHAVTCRASVLEESLMSGTVTHKNECDIWAQYVPLFIATRSTCFWYKWHLYFKLAVGAFSSDHIKLFFFSSMLQDQLFGYGKVNILFSELKMNTLSQSNWKSGFNCNLMKNLVSWLKTSEDTMGWLVGWLVIYWCNGLITFVFSPAGLRRSEACHQLDVSPWVVTVVVTPQLDNHEEDSHLLPVPVVKDAKGKLFLMQQPVQFVFLLLTGNLVRNSLSELLGCSSPPPSIGLF